MSYRRRETSSANFANPLSKAKRLAAVSSIWLVGHTIAVNTLLPSQARAIRRKRKA
jgi:hypothetical protein